MRRAVSVVMLYRHHHYQHAFEWIVEPMNCWCCFHWGRRRHSQCPHDGHVHSAMFHHQCPQIHWPILPVHVRVPIHLHRSMLPPIRLLLQPAHPPDWVGFQSFPHSIGVMDAKPDVKNGNLEKIADAGKAHSMAFSSHGFREHDEKKLHSRRMAEN